MASSNLPALDYLKCSEWYGSRLTVRLCKGDKVLCQSVITPTDQPRRLELISPIKESMLLHQPQQPPIVPPMPLQIAGNSPPYEVSSTVASFISSPIVPNAVHSPLSSVATTILYSGTTRVTTAETQGMILANQAQNSMSPMMTPPVPQQYAFQTFQNHSFAGYSETQLPVTSSDTLQRIAHPITANDPYGGGYGLISTSTYPVSYNYPPPPTQPRYPYHANPDGTLVNTTQGTVSMSESRAIVVRNLNFQATTEQIRAHFSSAGAVDVPDLATNRKEKKKCTRKITYDTAASARAAVAQFNGTDFQGRIISVEIAKDDSAIESNLGDSEQSLPEIASLSLGKSSPIQGPSESKARSGPLIVNGSDEDMINSLERDVRQSGKEKGNFNTISGARR
jgi:hypothetical protein